MRQHPVADRWFVVVSGLALVLSACGDAATASGDASVDELPEIALVEELRIGSLGDPRLGFSQIRAIESGTTAACTSSRDRTGRSGSTLRTARSFEGSGAPDRARGSSRTRSAWLAGDTLAVTEIGGNGRLTLFDRDGNLGRTIQVPAVDVPTEVPTIRLRIQPFRMRSDGRFDGQMTTMSMARASGVDRPDAVMAPRIVFDREGRPTDKLGWYAMPMGRLVRIGTTSVGVSPRLPDTDLSTEADGDSIVVHRPAAAAGGDAVFTVTRTREGGTAAGLDFTARWYFQMPWAKDSPEWQTLFTNNAGEWHALAVSDSTFPALDFDRVRALTVPTLLLSGGGNAGFNPLIEAQLARLLPNVAQAIIPDASHEMFLDDPGASAAALLDFFRRHSSVSP